MGFGLRFPIFGHAWCSYVGHAFSCWYFLRDRPFNLQGKAMGFFRLEFFFQTTQELEYYFFLSRKARIFFPEFNIRLYDKNSESDFFFFPPPKSEYFFQQHWESDYFLVKKHTPLSPPFQVKWSFPYVIWQKLWIRLFFFFLHQNQNIFFSNIGNQNICLEKKKNSTPPPPSPWKLNGSSLIHNTWKH